MNSFAKSALVLGAVGALALGSVTTSEARGGRWVAGAAGFAVGAAVGAAAANAAYGGYYGYGPDYAYDPGYDAYGYAPGYAYAGYDSYGYAPGYAAYGYAPGYPYRRYYRGRHIETQSVPHHYDPGGGYNSNTIAPWQDWKLQGKDY